MLLSLLQVLRRIAASAVLGVLLIAGGVWLYFALNGPEPQVWHRTRLGEEFTVAKAGDVTKGPVSGAGCRQAIIDWGGQHPVRAVESRFESVEYFACSPLGRQADGGSREAFHGHGLLEPLDWVLTGRRPVAGPDN